MELKLVAKLPNDLEPNSIEDAVAAFVIESHTAESGAEAQGLYDQTLESIAQICVFNQAGRQFWLATDNGQVAAYALCHVAKDVDNKFCYWMTQAWVCKKLRGTPIVKAWAKQLQAEGKRLLCKHIIIPSSRNINAYIRFLGGGFHPYVTLLKKDI